MASTKIIFSRFAFVFCLAALMAGCVFQASPLSSTAQVNHQTAIIYGRFSIGREFSFGNRLALWLQNLDSRRSIYIYFDPDKPIFGIEVKPGRYRVAGFAAVSSTHEAQAHREIPAGKSMPIITAMPGAQIYIGDYLGQTTYGGNLSVWRLQSCSNNFVATTVEFREKYPNLLTSPAISIFEVKPRSY